MSGGGTEYSCCLPFSSTHISRIFRRVGDPVPDEIETAFAGPKVVVEAGDRIGDHLLRFRQIEGEQRIDAVERFRREVGFVGAPRQI